jgi:hypothetical protein
MQFVGKLVTSVSDFYRDLNPSTLTGAMDVIVVEDPTTGERACTAFHVRIGKLNLMRHSHRHFGDHASTECTSVSASTHRTTSTTADPSTRASARTTKETILEEPPLDQQTTQIASPETRLKHNHLHLCHRTELPGQNIPVAIHGPHSHL